MAATATTSKHDEVYIAWQGFASALGDVAQGAKLRGDDPIVNAHPDMFVPADTPTSEWPSVFDYAIAQTEERERERLAAAREEFELAAAANPVRLLAPLHVKATRDFTTTIDGVPATIEKGSTVLEGSDLHVQHPDYFT